MYFERHSLSQHFHFYREGEGVLCSGCNKKAFKSCLTCTASFCELHVKQHYTDPELQRHRLVCAISDMEQSVCQQHHRELELLGKTDQTPVGVLCVSTQGRNEVSIKKIKHCVV